MMELPKRYSTPSGGGPVRTHTHTCHMYTSGKGSRMRIPTRISRKLGLLGARCDFPLACLLYLPRLRQLRAPTFMTRHLDTKVDQSVILWSSYWRKVSGPMSEVPVLLYSFGALYLLAHGFPAIRVIWTTISRTKLSVTVFALAQRSMSKQNFGRRHQTPTRVADCAENAGRPRPDGTGSAGNGPLSGAAGSSRRGAPRSAGRRRTPARRSAGGGRLAHGPARLFLDGLIQFQPIFSLNSKH